MTQTTQPAQPAQEQTKQQPTPSPERWGGILTVNGVVPHDHEDSKCAKNE
jgi:hypothetical protein